MKKQMKNIAACALLASVYAGFSSNALADEPRNVVQLSASASVQVPQDWLTVTLTATHDGRQAQEVQQQLQKALDAALRSAKPQAQGDALQVSSGNIGVYPRHDRNSGKVVGWQGRAEVLLQGRDFARITQAAAQIEGMTMSHLAFSLSDQGKAKVQEQAQTDAVAAFRTRAQQLTQAFGFNGYRLREVNVQTHGGQAPRVRMAQPAMLMDAKAEAQPMPVEAGTAEVVVEVSGSVQME